MAPPALAKAVQSRRRGDVDSAVAALQTGANVDAASAVWLRALALPELEPAVIEACARSEALRAATLLRLLVGARPTTKTGSDP